MIEAKKQFSWGYINIVTNIETYPKTKEEAVRILNEQQESLRNVANELEELKAVAELMIKP